MTGPISALRPSLKLPFHEPTHPRPLPGGEQASVRVLSVPLPGGVRGGFMVPMHAQKRKEATHEQRTPERQNLGWERSRDLGPTNGVLAPASHFFFPGINAHHTL